MDVIVLKFIENREETRVIKTRESLNTKRPQFGKLRPLN